MKCYRKNGSDGYATQHPYHSRKALNEVLPKER